MAKKETYEPVTGHMGIKRRLSDGMYIVTLDYGRQMKLNKRTGEYELRPVKTTRIVKTLKEAVKLREDNNRAKRRSKTSSTTGKLLFKDAEEAYFAKYSASWSDSKLSTERSYSRRCCVFLGNEDVRNIDTLKIEDFFQWCREDHKKETGLSPLKNITIQKIRTHLIHLWKYMKKNKTKWQITENVVLDADVGKLEEYKANYINFTQYNEFLEYALKNEHDYSSLALLGLAGMAGLRRGEVCGLLWKDIDQAKQLLDIHQQRTQTTRDPKGWTIKQPKGGRADGKTRFERRERYAALPRQLAELLELVKKQQAVYLDREPTGSEYVFMQKVDLVNGTICHPRALDKRFSELQSRYNKVRKKQGKETLPKLRLHDMRHSFITAMINEAKVEVLRVSVNVGHIPKGNTTIEKYWHDDNNRDGIREATEKLITTKIAIPNIEEDIKCPQKEQPKGRDLRNDDL